MDMIWTHIQPMHRSELLCHPPEQQSDLDEVLEILHHVFGDKRSVRDMFRELCQIQQREGEDLLMYSHRLMNVNRAYDQVCMKKKCNVSVKFNITLFNILNFKIKSFNNSIY